MNYFQGCIPIHKELRQSKKEIEVVTRGLNHYAIRFAEACGREANLLLKIERTDVEMNQLKEEIESLKSQIEVLSRPEHSSSILDKIRSYFEK